MEEMHRNHKEVTWGWIGVLLAVLDGAPRRRKASPKPRLVVTPWSHRSPGGWSA